MSADPIELYGRGLDAARSTGLHPVEWVLRDDEGTVHALPLAAWCADALPGDEGLLDRCTGPTLDLGCGPGRLVVALLRRGVHAVGVDTAPVAVRLARQAGAPVVQRSLFDRLPGEGGWSTALLADGNLGIGGDPVALLSRCRALLGPGGRVLVDLQPPGVRCRTRQLRIEGRRGERSAWFPWAQCGVDEIGAVAARAGLTVQSVWEVESRWQADLLSSG